MIKREKLFCGLKKYKISLIFLFLAVCFFFLPEKTSRAENNPPWVKVIEGKLIKGGKPFRFIGANAVNLVFYDDWGLDVEKAIRFAKEKTFWF